MANSKEQILARLNEKVSGFGFSERGEGSTIEKGDSQAFLAKASANQIGVQLVSDLASGLSSIAEAVAKEGWRQPLRVCPTLKTVWDDPPVSLLFGTTSGEEEVCISQAYAALEDTGSLVMLSSQGSPTLLNFLSTHHIVLLAKQRILKAKADLWPLIRKELPIMPRAINIITGPSRTADIEQTIQLGAHGPKQLTVILYDNHS